MLNEFHLQQYPQPGIRCTKKYGFSISNLTMKSSAPTCPIPSEQQPLNEYQSLRESWFYSWASRDLAGYLQPLIILWLASWVIAAPVAMVSFPWVKYPVKFFLSGAAGAGIIPVLVLVRLYLGWFYICDRLSRATIFYEESGWYDGQTWTKPDEMLQRDRLIVTYQIQPFLQRCQWTFGAIACLFLSGTLLWNFL